MDLGNGQIYNDDCFNVLPKIADKSVDLILCDLPYSRSASKWDKPLDLGKLWEQYKRVIKDDRAIVLFATQPFTTELISSNVEMYKYSWIWFKHSAPNFLNAKTMPLKVTEDVCVFGFKPVSYNKKGEYMLYNPQFSQGKPYVCKSGKQKADTAIIRDKVNAKSKMGGVITKSDGRRYPTTLLDFTKDKSHFHSTQKPVDLLRYLIRTYSNEGDLVLDNTAGSMSTAIAAIRENRRFVMIEKDPKYFEIGKKRIEEELSNPRMF